MLVFLTLEHELVFNRLVSNALDLKGVLIPLPHAGMSTRSSARMHSGTTHRAQRLNNDLDDRPSVLNAEKPQLKDHTQAEKPAIASSIAAAKPFAGPAQSSIPVKQRT